jgi:hypothetical protein
MKVLHANFDWLGVAFKGALPLECLEALARARADAETRKEPVTIELGPGKKLVRVFETGMRGGYRYSLDTGSDEARWCFKHSTDPDQWNILLTVHPGCFVERGYEGAKTLIHETAEAFGLVLGEESINRVDYAIDIDAPDLRLNPALMVAPKGTKTDVRTGQRDEADNEDIHFIYSGRTVNTITTGMMPGRQVTIYNKRRQAIDKKKMFWFEVWDIDPKDRSHNIFRTEVRLGKRELKDRWAIKTFDDLEAGFGDAILEAINSIRMVAPNQTDSNITRQALHPYWEFVTAEFAKRLDWTRAGLVRGQVRAIERSQATAQAENMLFTYAARKAILDGEDADAVLDKLPQIANTAARRYLDRSREKAAKSLQNTKSRLQLKVR